MDLKEKVLEDVAWIHLNQGKNQWWALDNIVMNLLVP
jgi:hypothetical protein